MRSGSKREGSGKWEVRKDVPINMGGRKGSGQEGCSHKYWRE